MEIVLSPRLQAVAEQIKRCGCVADIGTDHAYLAIYAVKAGLCDMAVASDIAKGPIEIAKRNIEKYSLSDKIETVVSDGMKKIPAPDTCVIAGMGGQMISEILSESEEKARSCKTLILQPMTFVHALREYLYNNNFYITDENLVSDSGKIYTIITAQSGETQPVQEKYYYIGKKLIEKKDPLLFDYIEWKKKSLNNALSEIEKSEVEVSEKKEELLKLLHIYNECEVEAKR